MSQKTILSFFKSKDSANTGETKSKSVIIKDSPVKKSKNKRKVQCLESDDESSEVEKKDLKGDSNKVTEVSENGIEKSSDLNSKNENKESTKVEVNGLSSGKPSKIKKVEKDDGKKSHVSPKKPEADSTKQQDECIESSTSSITKVEAVGASGTSNQNGSVNFIPKRKTARKQMSSAKNKRSDVKLEKEEPKSKISENKVDSPPHDGVDVKDDAKEDVVKDIIKENIINEDVIKDVIKEDDVREEDVREDIKEDDKEENESSPVKDSNEVSRTVISVNIGKKRDKKSPKVSKKSTDKKRKVATTPKAKDSPVKKSTKKESIHSFFTLLKKTEDEAMDVDKDEEETTKGKEDENEDSPVKKTRSLIHSSNQEENEDSPVKKTNKRNSKAKFLESEDEEEDSEKPNSAIDNETKDTELNTCSASPEKSEDATKAVDQKKSPLKTNAEAKVEVSSLSTEGKSKAPLKIKEEEVSSKNTEVKIEEPQKIKDEAKEEVSSKKTEVKKEVPSKETDKNSKDVGKQKLSLKSTSAVTTVYDPSKNNYHPIEDACWKRGEKVPYIALAKTMELIENISGRLKIIEILSNFLRSVIVLSPDDMLQSVYLCLNRLAPEYAGIELGVGETLLMKAVAQATGRTVEKIKAEVAIKGDLGIVSESSRGNQRVMFTPPKLTVSSVFQKFLEIAKMTGNSSMAKKTDKIKGLFIACRDCEAKYIIRSLSGKLRIGLAEQSVLSAIARAAVLTPPNQTYPPDILDSSKGMSSDRFKELLDPQILILKTAYCECPNYDLVIPVLLKEGISALPERCQLSPGIPLKPMLAHPTDGIDRVLDRFDKNPFTCEYKYDGERAQIHMTEKGDVKIFSRNQEDNTSKYPDIISRLSNAVKESTKSFVLDSEAVAWDKEMKQILPFQVLSTRKRKDAVESEIVVQVCIMAFDLLYLNGESLVKKPLKERRSLLHSSFNEVENEFMFAQYRDGNSAETMQEFLEESVKGNCEGLMVKALETDASYEIAKRSHNWLKLKKDYLQGIGDTLDLVVIGGYYGKGKRTGNYGGFLLACYDEDNEEFQSICKLGTGFKDENLEAHTKFLKQHTIDQPKSYYRYDHSLAPDEWFEPVQVWEIKCADLSISPVHKAAIGIIDPEKGISLRFPRFVRIRDDKTPENATNSVQIADMYQKQQQIQNTANKSAKTEEDYY